MITMDRSAGLESAPSEHDDYEHDGHHHDPSLAHHFENHKHQFDTSKLGIWLFLGQELLFFGGLFCAYAVYRGLHPEVFVEGHKFLDVTWGAINTCVLIFSSLTAAWSVRCAQLGQRKGLILSIAFTILCAFGFLGIKYVEYNHKIHEGLVWGRAFAPTATALEEANISEGVLRPPSSAENGDGPTITADKTRPNLHTFFSIYFAMTGLHGIHVVAGIILYFWILRRAIRGDFTPEYYGPVDFAALYWHLVDLVWIYLFPLLYLIH